ncbi:MAG: protease complex subunit PrcB family protein [Lachnospiraceae bacterium]|nr:protease complex subunit PrcB family protein [Lachnospiraceae bacterium]
MDKCNGNKWIKTLILTVVMIFVMSLTGCKDTKIEEKKIKDLDYTVLGENEIPMELKQIIEENKHNVAKTTYVDMGELYIIICYGDQPTTGYSIEVNELYETKNTIAIKTTLKGPSKSEEVLNMITSPYIVVKLENMEKTVVYK